MISHQSPASINNGAIFQHNFPKIRPQTCASRNFTACNEIVPAVSGCRSLAPHYLPANQIPAGGFVCRSCSVSPQFNQMIWIPVRRAVGMRQIPAGITRPDPEAAGRAHYNFRLLWINAAFSRQDQFSIVDELLVPRYAGRHGARDPSLQA